MKIEEGDFGQTFAVLDDGTRLRIAERRGRLEVTAYDGGLAIFPRSSNVVEIATVAHFPKVDS